MSMHIYMYILGEISAEREWDSEGKERGWDTKQDGAHTQTHKSIHLGKLDDFVLHWLGYHEALRH